jgi:hypothetical protein
MADRLIVGVSGSSAPQPGLTPLRALRIDPLTRAADVRLKAQVGRSALMTEEFHGRLPWLRPGDLDEKQREYYDQLFVEQPARPSTTRAGCTAHSTRACSIGTGTAGLASPIATRRRTRFRPPLSASLFWGIPVNAVIRIRDRPSNS